jgi:O-antigen/teichoic acid export membrane protein
VVATDAISRTLFALAVAVGVVNGAAPLALGIAVAPFISAAVWPLANFIVARKGHRTPRGTPNPESIDPNFTLTEGGGFATGLLFVMLSEQILLNSGPLLARTEVGAAAAGFIFNVRLVLRAPVVVFQGAAAVLLPHLTGIEDSGRLESNDEFERSVRVTLLAILGFGALTVAVVAAVGPALMQLAFGDKFEYPRTDLLIVAVGLPFYLAATTLTQAGLARRRVSAVSFAWSGAAAILIAWYIVSPLDVSRTIEVGLAGASALLFAFLWPVYRAGPLAPTTY